MREILFRGKDIYGKWHYGDLINLTSEIKQICNHAMLEHAHSVNPDTVGQYTGVADRNGNRIFEGDIVKDKTFLGVVLYDNSEGRFYVDLGADTSSLWCDFEIIGNIHDNPDIV